MEKWLFVFILLFSFSCQESTPPFVEEEDLIDVLRKIPGAVVTEIPAEDHFSSLFEIRLEQPIDHMNPDGGKFSQKLYLGHVGEALPVAFETEGYSRISHRTRELSPLLGINQLTVEHRYFGSSVPAPPGYEYLDIWQSANDHHRIVELFKEIYSAPWVSSGTSKGGDTALFHRRFFPGDVEATVAYVAPILFEEEDVRFLDYYNSQGSEQCRDKMKAFQRQMLMKIDSFPTIFENYVNDVNEMYGTSITFSLPYKDIIYHSIREDYAFEFWSSEIEDCNTIPDSTAPASELFEHYVGVFDVFLFFSDFGVDYWTPYIYQAKTQLGNYAYELSHLLDLEMDIPPLAEFNDLPTFDPSIMPDIYEWVKNESDNLILIYGEKDPWTHAAFDVPDSGEVLKIINPGSKHGTRISHLSSGNRDLVLAKLNLWLGIN